ncbi:carbonic anhydrase family protein [Vibrio parahaemolyticus]|nr:carbonic anhydrase family protein [Vibrio parahaemolyticus]EHV5558260.1 carbonic anhydrase family protein [Vibrio parahaemolyticus]
MKKTLLTLSLSFLTLGSAYASEWGYNDDQHGPAHWGTFAQDCSMTKNQSPINIEQSTQATLETLNISYSGKVIGFTNNGHTLQAQVDGQNTLTIDGKTFELQQFHFHTPSENMIKNHQYPLEAHFVHANDDGELAVISVMFDEAQPNSALTQLIRHIPEKDNTDFFSDGFKIRELLPESARYYRFNGSLTTPPCSEGVRWFVLKDTQSLSKEQASKFMSVMGQNNRPLQPLNARVVLSN